jgi:2-polyprenyl-3-methyl-5-hydroxy-6-metoxy-1,4-benzoquinol methylase
LRPAPAKPKPDVLKRYAAEPWRTRVYLLARWLWTPYEAIARLLPLEGRILDAGCGHGLLALTLALRSSARRVVAVDHDRERIGSARRAGRDLHGVRFLEGDFTRLPGGLYDGMVFLDVLHYLPWRAQEDLLRRAARRLRRRGVLVFREVAQGSSLFSRWNQVHERIMTAFGWTKADDLFFRTSEGWRRMAGSAGLKVRGRPMARPPFADFLYECTKP